MLRVQILLELGVLDTTLCDKVCQLYIVAVSFIGGGNRIPGENHRPVENN